MILESVEGLWLVGGFCLAGGNYESLLIVYRPIKEE